ncbi:MAG: DUF3553 domain-containing protein [Desulfobacterium sp.]|nr:DUF3553 domain-containing protein [Desulfobacterium sp.]
MSMINYKKGDRVKHPKMQKWGLGEVLGSSDGESVDVFFVGVGKKTLSKNAVLAKITGETAVNLMLDNIIITPGKIKFVNISEVIKFFLKRFPKGFYEEEFIEKERESKVKAHDLSVELLNKDAFLTLLQEKNYSELSKRALKVINATNLIFPNEKMSLKEGLKTPSVQREFSEKLYDLLFDEDDELQNRFEAFSTFLESIEAAKWTTASYFLFVHFPQTYMFVKPTVTRNVSKLCGFEINYQPKLNWLTYNSVLKFSSYLNTELLNLEPRDMIDVQSFMWCIEKYE